MPPPRSRQPSRPVLLPSCRLTDNFAVPGRAGPRIPARPSERILYAPDARRGLLEGMFRGPPSPASDRREPFTPQSSLCCRERPPPSAWPDYRRHLGEVIHVEDEIAFIVLKSDLA